MTKKNHNKRIRSALNMHKALLAKALSYSEGLQDKEAVERHTANIKKVEGMFK